tara:strand:+ start:46288 stop:47316 length:1029 start_codon:yes stop_codon:yes gene_type:complete
MAQKIATVSTVFAACDRLEAANERWNREDVRNAVGGGGYVVIDPLIKAWRELKPLREAAPTTPAELLHQVATTLESHINEFTAESESRLSESQQVFDATVSELSEKLVSLESALEENDASLMATEASNVELVEQLAQVQEELRQAKTENTRLVTENDALNGQVTRMEKEHNAAVNSLQAEHRELIQQHAQERTRISDEHAKALANQRKELTEVAEQAENRLMMLLDQGRQESKAAMVKLSGDLEEMTQKSQSNREAVIALESTVKALTGQNEKLESDLAVQEENSSELQAHLEERSNKADSIEREFNAYKEEHRLSGDLSALQAAVSGLQAQLSDREIDVKK